MIRIDTDPPSEPKTHNPRGPKPGVSPSGTDPRITTDETGRQIFCDGFVCFEVPRKRNPGLPEVHPRPTFSR